jgi:hypothetical protein
MAADLPNADRRRRAPGASAADASSHSLRLHGRRFPAEAVAAFLEAGTDEGARYFAVCSPAHWKAVQGHLASETAPCIFLDSRGVARRIAAGKEDALDALMAEVEALVLASRGQSRTNLRVFTDLGSRLRRAGVEKEALRAEEALDDLASRHGLTVLCAYPVDERDPRRRDYHQAMVRHDRVLTG